MAETRGFPSETPVPLRSLEEQQQQRQQQPREEFTHLFKKQGKNVKVKDKIKIAYYILFILAIISIMIFLGSLVLGIGRIGSLINMILMIFLVWLVKDWDLCPEYK